MENWHTAEGIQEKAKIEHGTTHVTSLETKLEEWSGQVQPFLYTTFLSELVCGGETTPN